jgi:hypothetical protein
MPNYSKNIVILVRYPFSDELELGNLDFFYDLEIKYASIP